MLILHILFWGTAVALISISSPRNSNDNNSFKDVINIFMNVIKLGGLSYLYLFPLSIIAIFGILIIVSLIPGILKLFPVLDQTGWVVALVFALAFAPMASLVTIIKLNTRKKNVENLEQINDNNNVQKKKNPLLIIALVIGLLYGIVISISFLS